MTTPANRWLLIGVASALAISMSACNKTPAATDTGNATADATAAPPATDTGNAMNAGNTAGTNTMSSSGGAAPSQ